MKIFSILLTLSLALTSACTSNNKKAGVTDYSRSFRAPYETVWRATQQALLNYPMNINNMDTGQLQTLYITGKHRYKAPHQKNKLYPSGYQYRLNITIIRGKTSSRVVIAKEVRLQKDFFSEPQELHSDGYEEKMILYRIKREVQLEGLLKRQLNKRQKKK